MKNSIIFLIILALQLPQLRAHAAVFELIKHLQQHSDEMIDEDAEDHDDQAEHTHRHTHGAGSEHEHTHSHPPINSISVDAQFLNSNLAYLFAPNDLDMSAFFKVDNLKLSHLIFEIFRPPIS